MNKEDVNELVRIRNYFFGFMIFSFILGILLVESGFFSDLPEGFIGLYCGGQAMGFFFSAFLLHCSILILKKKEAKEK